MEKVNTAKTHLHPDCLFFTDSNSILCSYYEQIGTEQKWKGGIGLFSYSLEDGRLEHQKDFDFSGIFDMELQSTNLKDNTTLFYTGHVDKQIKLCKYQGDKREIEIVNSSKTEEKVIYLKRSRQGALMATLSDGHFIMFQEGECNDQSDLQVIHQDKYGDNTIWACDFLEDSQQIMIGGDFGKFSMVDTRTFSITRSLVQ